MNKNSLQIAAILTVGLIMAGCSSFLDKKPMGVESSATFFKTKDQALEATTAVYDVTAWRYSQEIQVRRFLFPRKPR